MVARTSKIVADALELPVEERAEVIEALVRSLDAGDDLDDADRRRLHEALTRSDEQLRAGEGISAAEVLALLPKR